MNDFGKDGKHNQDEAWTKGRVPQGYWDVRANRVRYMRWLGNKLGYKKEEDWYALKYTHFIQNRGSGLMATCYNRSVLAALTDYMPDYQWKPWLLGCTPQGFWQVTKNRRAYMRWLEQQLNIERNSDWYQVSKKDFANNGGSGLLQNYYDNSVVMALKDFKPRMRMEEWRFESIPTSFWSSEDNFRRYMDWLSVKLDIRTPELWYGVSVRDVEKNHGSTPLNRRGGSLNRLVSDYLPEIDWKPWLFTSTSANYWRRRKNRQTYLNWLGKELGFRRSNDWYQLTQDDFKRTGGMGLFTDFYRNSLLRAARERYPKYSWDARKFQQ